ETPRRALPQEFRGPTTLRRHRSSDCAPGAGAAACTCRTRRRLPPPVRKRTHAARKAARPPNRAPPGGPSTDQRERVLVGLATWLLPSLLILSKTEQDRKINLHTNVRWNGVTHHLACDHNADARYQQRLLMTQASPKFL